MIKFKENMTCLQDTLDLGILSYLEIDDCKNLQFVNQNTFQDFKKEYWSLLFLEKYNLLPCFSCQQKHVENWLSKNSYRVFIHFYGKQLSAKFILCFLKKKRVKRMWKIFDYFFPKYETERNIPELLYTNDGKFVHIFLGYYFEVTFSSFQKDLFIQCGFDNVNNHRSFDNNLTGWDIGSIAFHSDDDSIYYNVDKTIEKIKLEPMTESNTLTIGCGFDAKQNCFFFTKNGQLVATIKNNFSSSIQMIPICHGEFRNNFEFNDGVQKFKFDLRNIVGFRALDN
jgi:hypothetical protein